MVNAYCFSNARLLRCRPFQFIQMSRLTELIPAPDRAILVEAFQQHQEALPKMTPEQFIDDIVWRIYTEVCCSPGGYHISSPRPHAGNAFKQWIDKEVHYALEGTPIDDANYAEVRHSIMRAVAARAAELFSAWGGKTYPKDKNDERNLRASLRSYLPSHLRNESRPPATSVFEGIDPDPTIEQKSDGSTELHWAEHDASTVVFAKGTPDRPLPELLMKDPRRAADLIFAPWSDRPEASATTPTEETMPVMPENARSVEINTDDVAIAHNLGMQLMMATGSITARNGSAVSLSISAEKFPKVWDICKKYGITAAMVSFR